MAILASLSAPSGARSDWSVRQATRSGAGPRSRSLDLDTLEDRPLRILIVTTEFPSPQRPGIAAFLIRHVDALRQKGHHVEVLYFASRANPLNHLRGWLQMRRLLRDSVFDIVHAHFGQSALVARAQRYAPLVVTYHGSDLIGVLGDRGRYTFKGKLGSAVSRLMSRTAAAGIVVAEHLGRRLPRKDWSVIPLGVDLEQFQLVDRRRARDQLGWPQDVFIVLFAAWNASTPVKRLWLARAAFDAFRVSRPAELKIAEGLPPEQIPLHMCAADVLLLTSAHEGSPTVVKEAMACNLPVVTTDVGDVRERLRGVAPSFVCKADPTDLAAALGEIANSGRRSNGRELIQQLSESIVAEKVVGVYREAIAKARGRARSPAAAAPRLR